MNKSLNILVEKILQKEKGFAVFDFDNTVIKGDLGESCLHYAAENRLWKISEEFLQSFQSNRDLIIKQINNPKEQNSPDPNHPLYKYLKEIHFSFNSTLKENPHSEKIIELILGEYLELLKDYGPKIAYPWSAVLFSGYTIKEFAEHSKNLILSKKYSKVQKETKFNLNFEYGFEPSKEMLELILTLKNNSYPVQIISASPTELVQCFFSLHPEYKITNDNIIGMEIQKQNDVFTSRISPPMTYREGKVEAFYNKYPKEKIIFAAGDSITDFAMLEEAQLSLFIDRGNKEYRSYAEKKDWNIITQELL